MWGILRFLKRALTTTRYVVYSPAHQTYSRCSVLRSFMHLQALVFMWISAALEQRCIKWFWIVVANRHTSLCHNHTVPHALDDFWLFGSNFIVTLKLMLFVHGWFCNVSTQWRHLEELLGNWFRFSTAAPHWHTDLWDNVHVESCALI